MSINTPDNFDDLVARHLDGDLSLEEGQYLNKLLEHDQEKAKEFARAAVMHQQLRSVLKYSRTVDASASHSNSSTIVTGWTWFSGGAVTASIICIATFFILFKSPTQQVVNISPKVENASQPVAYLTSTTGCDLANAKFKKSWSVGDELQLGDEISLREGIAEFKLGSGVTLSVEGPAALILTSPNSLVLRQGIITTHVPWEVKDFSLVAGTCRLTGSDVEFGVDLSGNTIEIHSFLGEVAVDSSPFSNDSANSDLDPEFMESDDVPEFEPIVVRQNDAASFSLSGGSGTANLTKSFKANASRFATKLSMSGRLPITHKYVDLVKAAEPVGYWRFESSEGNEIRNEIPNRGPLLVTAKLDLQGDSMNHVLSLDNPIEMGNLMSRDVMDPLSKGDYSVEIWAKPSHFHRGYLVTLIENASLNRAGFFLEARSAEKDYKDHPGTLRFAQRSPLGVSGGSCFSSELYSLRRWQHVVAVKQKSSMTLFINGKVVGEAKGKANLPRGLNLIIGRPAANKDAFPFFGQLDELSIYDRPLTSQEVLEHFNAVQPGVSLHKL